MHPQKISDLYTTSTVLHASTFIQVYSMLSYCFRPISFKHLHAGMAGFTVHTWRVSDGAVYPTEHHHVGKAVNPEQPF